MQIRLKLSCLFFVFFSSFSINRFSKLGIGTSFCFGYFYFIQSSLLKKTNKVDFCPDSDDGDPIGCGFRRFK